MTREGELGRVEVAPRRPQLRVRGLAVLATLATERTQSLAADGEAAMTALNSGFHLAYVVGAVVLAAALAIAATVLLPEGAAKPAPAERERDGARSDRAYSMA